MVPSQKKKLKKIQEKQFFQSFCHREGLENVWLFFFREVRAGKSSGDYHRSGKNHSFLPAFCIRNRLSESTFIFKVWKFFTNRLVFIWLECATLILLLRSCPKNIAELGLLFFGGMGEGCKGKLTKKTSKKEQREFLHLRKNVLFSTCSSSWFL